MPPVYLIGNVHVRDRESYKAYTDHVTAVVKKFGGRSLVRGGAVHVLEGPERYGRVVLVEFPSMEAARAFYESPDYAPLLRIRWQHATSELAFVEGWEPPR